MFCFFIFVLFFIQKLNHKQKCNQLNLVNKTKYNFVSHFKILMIQILFFKGIKQALLLLAPHFDYILQISVSKTITQIPTLLCLELEAAIENIHNLKKKLQSTKYFLILFRFSTDMMLSKLQTSTVFQEETC